MLVHIKRELTKTESKVVTSEQLLARATRVVAPKAQSININSLNKTKDFDKIKKMIVGRAK